MARNAPRPPWSHPLLALLLATSVSLSLGGGCGDDPVVGVACEEAVDGDPCSPEGDQWCGPMDGYGCWKTCESGTWSVTCEEPPTCEDYDIEQGVACNHLYNELTCGPFEVDTLCGTVSADAECSPFGWYYDLPCDPDCESLEEATCSATTGCVWAVPCLGEPNTVDLPPRCFDFPPFGRTCGSMECAPGETCVHASLGPDLNSSDCNGNGSLVPVCVTP